MSPEVWLISMFGLGIASLLAMLAFIAACDRV